VAGGGRERGVCGRVRARAKSVRNLCLRQSPNSRRLGGACPCTPPSFRSASCVCLMRSVWLSTRSSFIHSFMLFSFLFPSTCYDYGSIALCALAQSESCWALALRWARETDRTLAWTESEPVPETGGVGACTPASSHGGVVGIVRRHGVA
jgi:hypothetical protein